MSDKVMFTILLFSQELDALNFIGDYRPNFHKLQVYSNVLEDLIEESPTFSYILKSIKVCNFKC